MLLLGDNGRRLGVFQPDEKRLVAESGKKRLGNGPDLQNAEDADIELRDLVHEQADAFALADTQSAQKGADGVAGPADVVVGEILFHTAHAFPVQGGLRAVSLEADAVRAVPADVEDSAGSVFQLPFGDRP